MGTWFQEEVAGDRYIFDSELNPVVLGCPQGAPVFVIPGEHAAEAERACVAHNAALAESFRVVPVEDVGLMYDWYMTPTGLGYPGKDRKQNNCIESAWGYYRLDECKPVRLERWEKITAGTAVPHSLDEALPGDD